MPTPLHHGPSPHPETGADVITEIIHGEEGGSAPALAGEIERRAEAEGVKGEVAPLTGELRSLYGFTITTLDGGVGGDYNPGSAAVRMSTSVLEVQPGQSIEQAAERVGEVGDHEKFHKEHKHNPTALQNEFAEGSTIVMIGGNDFEATPLIEGVTVYATGDTYVDGSYRGYKRDIESAMAASSLSFQQIVQAIDSHNLSSIDDRGGDDSDAEPRIYRINDFRDPPERGAVERRLAG